MCCSTGGRHRSCAAVADGGGGASGERGAPPRAPGGATAAAPARPDPRPLYVQVEEILTRRIASGDWRRPGELLPPEPELAQELGVSHGTVRKALDALERRRLIERRQGRGTFVAAHTSERALFHFFRVTDLAGRKVTPTSRVVSCETGPAGEQDARALRLPAGTPVHRLSRLRLLDGRPRILEWITLPAALFPDFSLPVGRELTDEVYVLYQRRFGVTVARAEEALAARAADAEAAEALDLPEGHPLIEIDRVAYDLQDRPVERRVTLLDTTRYRYRANLD